MDVISRGYVGWKTESLEHKEERSDSRRSRYIYRYIATAPRAKYGREQENRRRENSKTNVGDETRQEQEVKLETKQKTKRETK